MGALHAGCLRASKNGGDDGGGEATGINPICERWWSQLPVSLLLDSCVGQRKS